jgi:membrane protease subunit (stomatin/prohibitin family)
MEILWGTASPIQVRDPIMMIQTSVRARGAYKIQIDSGAKFLTKLLGNNIAFELQAEITNYFDNEFQQYIKSSIAKAIQNSGREILGICAEQDVLAKNIQPILQEIFDDYGVRLISFSISGIDIPENDPNRQKLEDAFSSKGVMNILGSDWGRQQASEILHDLANNPGSGGVAAAGAGLGMGMAAGSAFGNMAQQMFSPMQQAQQAPPPAPPQPSGRFVQSDAAAGDAAAGGAAAGKTPAEELLDWKRLLDAGVLTEEEFAAKKKQLLGL